MRIGQADPQTVLVLTHDGLHALPQEEGEVDQATFRRRDLSLDALSDLDMQKYVDAQASWYQWSAVLPYQRRILEALDVPIDRRFVWDPSG